MYGISSFRSLSPAEGNDAYMTTNMKQFCSDTDHRKHCSNSHGRTLTSLNQCDITVNNNDYIVVSLPCIFKPNNGLLSHLALVNLKERPNTVGIEHSKSSEEQQSSLQN